MAKYRNKPVVVDAVQFDPSGSHRINLPAGVDGIPAPGSDNWAYQGNGFSCETLLGRVPVNAGDFVLTYADGVMVVLPVEEFTAGFELAETEAPAGQVPVMDVAPEVLAPEANTSAPVVETPPTEQTA